MIMYLRAPDCPQDMLNVVFNVFSSFDYHKASKVNVGLMQDFTCLSQCVIFTKESSLDDH